MQVIITRSLADAEILQQYGSIHAVGCTIASKVQNYTFSISHSFSSAEFEIIGCHDPNGL